MPRQILRAKTGCNRCKIRKKKCDEQRPVCGSCLRLDLLCTWGSSPLPTADTESATYHALQLVMRDDLSISRAPLSKISRPGYQPFQSQMQMYLTLQSEKILAGLVCPTAGQEYDDLSIIVTLGIREEWVRHALSAFSAIILIRQGEKYGDYGLQNYQSAVISLRNKINQRSDGAGDTGILVATIFLGLVEALGIGNAELAVVHFLAAARLCNQYPRYLSDQSTPTIIYRVAVECVLYNLSCLSMFYSNSDLITQSIDWTSFARVFGRLPDSPPPMPYTLSPFLGGNHEIYKLVLQVTCFGRADLPNHVRVAQAAAWTAELDKSEVNLSTYYGSELPKEIADLYYNKFIVHIYALHILVLKIADHEACSSSFKVRQFVQQGLHVFSHENLREEGNPAVSWPLIVFLCACHEDSTFNTFVNEIKLIQANFDEGHSKRLLRIIDRLEKRRKNHHCAGIGACDKSHDGLDLLLLKDGILSGDDDSESISHELELISAGDFS